MTLLLALAPLLLLGVYRQATATRQAVNDARTDLLDSGSIQFRTGPQPTNVDDAAGGTLLGTVTLAATSFGATNSSGVATAGTIGSDTSADNSGTVGHGRLLKSGGTIHSDCSCSGTGGGGDIVFDNPVIVAGGTIAVSSLTMTEPV
jgi:hypothetical protein